MDDQLSSYPRYVLSQTFPHSASQLKKLGRAIKHGETFDAQLYEDWMKWNAEMLATAWLLLDDCVGEFIQKEPPPIFGAFPPLTHDAIELSGRVKTEDTTREKLQRNTTALNRIQDIIGLRIDGPMTLDQQSRLTQHIDYSLRSHGADVVQKDLRDGSHCGYRAMHLHATFPAGRAEIQVRTSAQSAWANLYEVLADIAGREIRYEQEFSPAIEAAYGPLIRDFWRVSEALYGSDTSWNEWVSTCEGTRLQLTQVPEPYPTALQIEIDRVKSELKTMHEGREHVIQQLSNLAVRISGLPAASRQEGDV